MTALDVVLGLVQREGRWFLQRRARANPILPGHWEFPGGKVHGGESITAALVRELMEELAWEPVELIPMQVFEGMAQGSAVRLHPVRCDCAGQPRTPLAWGWFTVPELRRLRLPEANHPLLDLLV